MKHMSTHRQGAALILCVVMTAAFLSVITMLSVRTVAHVRHSQYAAWRVAADASAELLLELAEQGHLEDTGQILDGVAEAGTLPRVDSVHITAQHLEGVPDMSYYLLSGVVENQREDFRYRIVVAEVEGVHSAVEALYRRQGDGWERWTWRSRRVSTGEGTS